MRDSVYTCSQVGYQQITVIVTFLKVLRRFFLLIFLSLFLSQWKTKLSWILNNYSLLLFLKGHLSSTILCDWNVLTPFWIHNTFLLIFYFAFFYDWYFDVGKIIHFRWALSDFSGCSEKCFPFVFQLGNKFAPSLLLFISFLLLFLFKE